MARKIEGMEISGKPPDYFSIWKDGYRYTGGSKLFKTFNYGVMTGEKSLIGSSVMILYGPLTRWSQE